MAATQTARWSRIDTITIAAFTSIGFALRFPLLGRGFWRDEGSTYADIVVPTMTQALANVARNELTPPLYFVIERMWIGIAGLSETAMRTPSLLFGLVTIVLIYALGRRAGGRGTAIVSAFCATFAPLAVEVQTEARAYALSLVLAVFVLYAVVRIDGAESARGRAIWASATLVAGVALIYAYFAGFVILAAVACYFAGVVVVRRDANAAAALAAVVGAMLCGFPMLRHLSHASGVLGRWTDVHDSAPIARIDDHLNAFAPFGSMETQLNRLVRAGLAFWAIGALRRTRQRADGYVVMMLTILIFGIGASIARSLPIERHLAIYAPAWWVLCGLLLDRLRQWIGDAKVRAVAALPVAYLVLVGVARYPAVYANALAPISGVRDALASLRLDRTPRTLVVAVPDYLGASAWPYVDGNPNVSVRGVVSWARPQFYNIDAAEWADENLAQTYARRVRSEAGPHDRIVLLIDRSARPFAGVPFPKAIEVASELERERGVLSERRFPGTRESIDAVVLK